MLDKLLTPVEVIKMADATKQPVRASLKRYYGTHDFTQDPSLQAAWAPMLQSLEDDQAEEYVPEVTGWEGVKAAMQRTGPGQVVTRVAHLPVIKGQPGLVESLAGGALDMPGYTAAMIGGAGLGSLSGPVGTVGGAMAGPALYAAAVEKGRQAMLGEPEDPAALLLAGGLGALTSLAAKPVSTALRAYGAGGSSPLRRAAAWGSRDLLPPVHEVPAGMTQAEVAALPAPKPTGPVKEQILRYTVDPFKTSLERSRRILPPAAFEKVEEFAAAPTYAKDRAEQWIAYVWEPLTDDEKHLVNLKILHNRAMELLARPETDPSKVRVPRLTSAGEAAIASNPEVQQAIERYRPLQAEMEALHTLTGETEKVDTTPWGGLYIRMRGYSSAQQAAEHGVRPMVWNEATGTNEDMRSALARASGRRGRNWAKGAQKFTETDTGPATGKGTLYETDVPTLVRRDYAEVYQRLAHQRMIAELQAHGYALPIGGKGGVKGNEQVLKFGPKTDKRELDAEMMPWKAPRGEPGDPEVQFGGPKKDYMVPKALHEDLETVERSREEPGPMARAIRDWTGPFIGTYLRIKPTAYYHGMRIMDTLNTMPAPLSIKETVLKGFGRLVGPLGPVDYALSRVAGNVETEAGGKILNDLIKKGAARVSSWEGFDYQSPAWVTAVQELASKAPGAESAGKLIKQWMKLHEGIVFGDPRNIPAGIPAELRPYYGLDARVRVAMVMAARNLTNQFGHKLTPSEEAEIGRKIGNYVAGGQSDFVRWVKPLFPFIGFQSRQIMSEIGASFGQHGVNLGPNASNAQKITKGLLTAYQAWAGEVMSAALYNYLLHGVWPTDERLRGLRPGDIAIPSSRDRRATPIGRFVGQLNTGNRDLVVSGTNPEIGQEFAGRALRLTGIGDALSIAEGSRESDLGNPMAEWSRRLGSNWINEILGLGPIPQQGARGVLSQVESVPGESGFYVRPRLDPLPQTMLDTALNVAETGGGLLTGMRPPDDDQDALVRWILANYLNLRTRPQDIGPLAAEATERRDTGTLADMAYRRGREAAKHGEDAQQVRTELLKPYEGKRKRAMSGASRRGTRGEARTESKREQALKGEP